jgi:prevent-host-death family protein
VKSISDQETGIRELKTHLSAYLRDVKAGNSIVVTEHGKPIAQLSPYEESLEAKLQRMLDAGSARWSGNAFEIREPVAEVDGEKSASDLIVEERDSNETTLG